MLLHKDTSHFCELEEIYLGVAASQTFQESKATIPENDLSSFLKNCLQFYIELCNQIKNRFTFEDDIFDIIEIVDPVKAQSFSVKSLTKVINKFSFLKNYINCQELDNEWRQHGLMDFKDLHMNPSKPAEEYWKHVLDLKNSAGVLLFPNLKKVIQFILILPFSNASVERIFSDLNNIKTDNRSRLDTSNITALLHTKEGIKELNGLLNFEPTPEMLNSNFFKSKNTQ